MACISRYDTDGAVALMNRAIQIDLQYARAYALLSAAYVLKFFADYTEGRTLNAALDYAERALSIDDNDDLSQAAMGQVQLHLGHWELARIHLEKAASLNPNSVLISTMVAHWLIRVGRAQEALETLDTALQRDPLQPPWYWEIRGMALLQEKRYEEVIQAVSHKNSLQPWDHATLAVAHAYLGHDEEARKEASIAVRMQPKRALRCRSMARLSNIPAYALLPAMHAGWGCDDICHWRHRILDALLPRNPPGCTCGIDSHIWPDHGCRRPERYPAWRDRQRRAS
jgi:tetratricopeptide (TPR) repeat protein